MEDVVVEDALYDPVSYQEYLRRYTPLTRVHLVRVADPPQVKLAPNDRLYPKQTIVCLHLVVCAPLCTSSCKLHFAC